MKNRAESVLNLRRGGQEQRLFTGRVLGCGNRAIINQTRFPNPRGHENAAPTRFIGHIIHIIKSGLEQHIGGVVTGIRCVNALGYSIGHALEDLVEHAGDLDLALA